MSLPTTVEQAGTVDSRHYKNVTDDDGNHVSDGEEREVPWVARTPVVQAIGVLERMMPEGALLLSAAHTTSPTPAATTAR
ncbi:hypothetical protein ACFY64_39475 [Streptomyces collinus]|uniref:hypothetical protein n=1 Tax=Streptomyces collinus TaxID=42684 RepID=UPI0036783293